MKVCDLIGLIPFDEVRLYEEDFEEIDEYTPYKKLSEIDLNREVYYLYSIIEGSNGEYENDWIAVILKEEQNA